MRLNKKNDGKMKLIKKQTGFTLVELLVTVAILGTIGAVISMAIIAIYKISPQSNNHVIALQQVQNAGFWISNDVKTAGEINDAPGAPAFLEFTVPLPGGGEKTVTYELQNTADGMKKLLRSDSDAGTQILIAQHLYYNPGGDPENSTKAIYDSDNRSLLLQITAVSGTVTVSRQYGIEQRVTADEG